MKKYILEVVVEEGHDEFWEEINSSCKSGCDDIRDAIKELLDGGGFYDASIKIVEFTDKE